MTEHELIVAFPHLPWREPVKITVPNKGTGLAAVWKWFADREETKTAPQ